MPVTLPAYGVSCECSGGALIPLIPPPELQQLCEKRKHSLSLMDGGCYGQKERKQSLLLYGVRGKQGGDDQKEKANPKDKEAGIPSLESILGRSFFLPLSFRGFFHK